MFRRGNCALALGVVCIIQTCLAQETKVGGPVDWSSRHIVHGRLMPGDAASNDPRALYDALIRERARATSAVLHGPVAHSSKKKSAIAVDWNFALGAGTVAQGMSPAKYSFDVGSGTLTAANCTSDYLVYALNIAGSATQPNLVRFNNIYAGTGGLCGAAPSIASAYTINTLDAGAVNSLNGVLKTSPALSLDGKKMALIETVTGNTHTCPGLGSNSTCAIFHVLTWATTGTNGSFDNTTKLYSAAAPASGNDATITTLSYTSSTNSLSSPWIDYRGGADNAYFGDDNGKLYKTTCVFYCAVGLSPQLAAGWPVTVAAAGVKLGPPVLDSVSNKVFVGGSDGSLYMVNLALCPGANCTVAGGGIKSVVVGSANAFGGVVDAPVIDPSFQTVFAFAGDNGAGSGVALQTDTSFVLNVKFTMGGSAFFNIYAGALDDTYYQNAVGGATVGGNLFVCGQLGGSGQPDLYWVPFIKNAGNLSTANPPRLNTAGSSKVNVPGNPGIGCTPLTEFKNGATDRLFFSQSSLPSNKCVSGSPSDGCMMMYDITTPATTIGNGPNAAAVENAGTSAVIVDNASASAQAASVYFANQGTATCTTGTGLGTTPSFCAVKLTQSLLQ